ncbi:MAG TPA: dephospho-CoA kinase [Chloroflexota bacterium]|nr:dephospho-CoA kinase [Chloroflexota bacterium]
MLTIGITGNIACGKSTVDAMLRTMGATEVLDADRVVHDLLRADPDVREALQRAFGSEVFAADGSVDRTKLGTIVFADPHALQALEGILHPAVRQAIRGRLAAMPEDALVVVDAVKLLEGELAALVDQVWWVTARVDQQIDRLTTGRGLSREAALARLHAQPSLEQFRDRVQVVIDNSGQLAHTRMQVEIALNDLLASRGQREARGRNGDQ